MIRTLDKAGEVELISQTTYYVRDIKSKIDMLTTSDAEEAHRAFRFCKGNLTNLRKWRKLHCKKPPK
jgi:hypothetical protein